MKNILHQKRKTIIRLRNPKLKEKPSEGEKRNTHYDDIYNII